MSHVVFSVSCCPKMPVRGLFGGIITEPLQSVKKQLKKGFMHLQSCKLRGLFFRFHKNELYEYWNNELFIQRHKMADHFNNAETASTSSIIFPLLYLSYLNLKMKVVLLPFADYQRLIRSASPCLLTVSLRKAAVNLLYIQRVDMDNRPGSLLHKKLIHFLLHMVEFFGAEHKAMQRRSHVGLYKGAERAGADQLVGRTHPREPKAPGVRGVGLLPADSLGLKQLLDALLDGHKARRLINLPILQYILLSPFLDLDIHQHQRMQPCPPILQYFLVPAVRPPLLSPQRHRNHFSEAVHLQPAAPHRADDAGVVDHLHLDAEFGRPEEKIGVRGGAESVSDHQKGIVGLLVLRDAVQQMVDFDFTKIAVGFDEFDSQEGLELLVGGAHDGGVVLKVDFFAASDGFERLD